MSGYLAPMLALVGVSEANHLYNTGQFDLKIPVMGGVACALLALFSEIPGMSGACQGIAWVAFVAMCVTPVQNPSPVTNLLKITGS